MIEPDRYIHNSSNPLNSGEELYRECEMGLDEEELVYIKENHSLEIRIGGEPFKLFLRSSSGSIGSGNITSITTQDSQVIGTVWTPANGELAHPDTRMVTGTFAVYNNGSLMTRVADPDFLQVDTEYAVVIEVGTNLADRGTIRVYFNSGFTPGTLAYTYTTLCSCVDIESGYPNRACPICKGTSYPISFTQYVCSGTKYNPANTILVRVPMAPERRPVDKIGRVIKRQHKYWTLAEPYINNYDIVAGTIGQNSGVLFEVISKFDSRYRGILTHQEFDVLRIEESDIRYTLIPTV